VTGATPDRSRRNLALTEFGSSASAGVPLNPEIAQWDPAFTARIADRVRPLVKRYFRSEVRGMDHMPRGKALVVSNHSGGALTPDVLVFCTAFYEKYGYRRPVFTLAHDQVYIGPFANWLPRAGVIRANRESAAEALDSRGVVLVFPGGDFDSYRPTSSRNTIDFNGRTGYVQTAIQSRAPIVPVVSIGAQEGQLFVSRGEGIARSLGLQRLRVKILPISIGFPFGLSVLILPPNVPLPTKIVTQVLEPVHVTRKFGRNPDVKEVDAYIRNAMQSALDDLAEHRRFPIIG
jgi:1-acyl-sn-glycerol-3-phosphate acyltransferase